ncbi:hypothetical protein Hanom_Chr02g00106901 [Helianthus anomalus]
MAFVKALFFSPGKSARMHLGVSRLGKNVTFPIMLLLFCLFSRCFIICVMIKGCLHLKFRYICMSVIYIPGESGVLLLIVVVLGSGVAGIMAGGTPAFSTDVIDIRGYDFRI